jgi:hypothetical protein
MPINFKGVPTRDPGDEGEFWSLINAVKDEYAWRPGGGGTDGGSYTHHQTVADTTWTINSPLNFYPNVSVVDSTGEQIFPGSLVYSSVALIILTFSSAVGGEAYLS